MPTCIYQRPDWPEFHWDQAALANQLAATARKSNGGVKSLLLATFGNGLEEQMELEGRLIANLADSADGREGIDAFLAKRKAEFR